jgi:hypothetical protein
MLQCNRERRKNTERDRGQRRKIRIAARDNGTPRHRFFRVIDHLPGEILDREFLTSVVHVLITEQLHRSVPPGRSDDLVARQPWCAEDCDYCFLPLLGNNGDLDLAFLDIEDRVGGISLRKDGPIFAALGEGASIANFGKKRFWIERRCFDHHGTRSSIACRPAAGLYLRQGRVLSRD